jgi:endonuclease YncB( thermonuclease family)
MSSDCKTPLSLQEKTQKILNCHPSLQTACKNDSPMWNEVGDLDKRHMPAKAYQVYDGDTFRIIVQLPESKVQNLSYRCRLLHIDTPELRTKDIVEKALACEAREYARGLIDEKVVYVTCGTFEKWGRTLVELEALNENGELVNLAKELIRRKLALPYEGAGKGTVEERKEKWATLTAERRAFVNANNNV